MVPKEGHCSGSSESCLLGILSLYAGLSAAFEQQLRKRSSDMVIYVRSARRTIHHSGSSVSGQNIQHSWVTIMSQKATIPGDRIHLPATFAASGALEYLSIGGLPPTCEWRHPLDGRYFDQYRVNFTALNDPRLMLDLLLAQDTPEWLVSYQNWKDFLAIGTWETTGPTGFKMKWHICVNIHDGRIFRVETNPDNLRLSLKSNEEMAARGEKDISAIKPISIAQLECAVFMNSSPRQLMQSFEIYFSFVNRDIVSAEAFLESISRVDSPAGENGTVWYLLVANFLKQDEY